MNPSTPNQEAAGRPELNGGPTGTRGAPDHPPAALEMRDVTVTALKDPPRVVAEGVNWRVESGEFWVIGGLHASGKSDLMAVAAGLMPPARGTCRVFGHEPGAGFEQERLAARLRVGLVFDGGQLLNHLTIAENISLPLRYHQDCTALVCADAVAALLELTELTQWANHYPADVSRNRRQRAGLARALALRPDLLLLDSPLTGLDPEDAAWWLDLLGMLSAGHAWYEQRPATLVVTGDNLHPWRSKARHFGVLRDGRLQSGPREHLLEGPGKTLTQELLDPATGDA